MVMASSRRGERGALNLLLVVGVTCMFVRVTSLSLFQQPIRTSPLHNPKWRLASSDRQSPHVPSMTFQSTGDDDLDATSSSTSALFYIPDSNRLPPRTKELFTQLSDNYIFNTRRQPVTLEQVLEVIEAEHTPFDVPITLDRVTIDVKQTGDEVDESVAEIFSLAAMYAVPKEVTLYLLDSCILGTEQGDAKSELQLCRDIFADKGWNAVSFPKGLALQVMKKYQIQRKSQTTLIIPFSLFRRQKRRIEQAKEAVARAQTTPPPKQRFESRQDFFRTMEEELLDSSTPSVQAGVLVGSSSKNLFFPKQSAGETVRRGLRKLTRLADKQYARLKSSGRAGIVSYCFLNLIFYTIGVVFQWQRIGVTVNPLQESSATAILLKKFAKVFGSLYVASQFTKLPKVVAAVGLTPVAQRAVDATKKNLRVSETVATVLLVGVQYVAWLGIVTIPILAEYTKLRRLIEFERLVDIKQVAPAFYTVTMGVLQLTEC